MTPVALALTVGGYLLPYLNTFLSAAAPELGKKAPDWIASIWARLHPKVEAKEAAKEAADDAAKDAADADAIAAFRVQLRKIFEADPDLASEISKLVAEGEKLEQGGGQKASAGDNSNIIQIGHDNAGDITIGDKRS
jgi:hypothetical protein